MACVRVSPKDCKKDGCVPTNPLNVTAPPNEPFVRRRQGDKCISGINNNRMHIFKITARAIIFFSAIYNPVNIVSTLFSKKNLPDF